MTQGIERNILRVAPPLLGHRSSLAGETERRGSQRRGAMAMQDTRMKANMLKRTGNSP
jgi:hypothetical protein